MTSGQWSWKLKSAKECVTTHLTNAIALKINGAESVRRYFEEIRVLKASHRSGYISMG